ncbi:protein of unknown function DUF81 [Desulfofarcimen acetoxidans DSM 771]|uniref:Probable membrane transporter protein n=1 Tax=Desulfofarcimen acetoxidans (strain ATCC 49208 / DSM 771 / KCTC 5769 / VKM B-1644 / 5575) TaxID=485916 RepID=C8W0U4_DESAS|nr:sulfite exporter TauE/SafE family protein [Desulfofarcimen acetoxidans]ACV63349.1 protein of unknown function DUF81 [Desulfofarcimen acetoxidans DSM 771]
MEMEALLFLILIVGLSAFVQGLTGFGIGIPMMLFLPFVFSYQTSVAVTVICAIVISCVLLFKTRENVEIKKILPVTIPVVIMQIISTYFLFVLSDDFLTIALVIILLLFAGLFIVSDRGWQIKASVPNSILAGCATGVCNMLGIGGPPLGYYYHSIFEENIHYLANLQATLLISCATLLIQHIIEGNITLETFEYSAIASVVCVIVLLPAMKVFKKLDRSKLTKIIIVFLIVMAIIKLVEFYLLGGGK